MVEKAPAPKLEDKNFQGTLDWATEDDTITSRELRELRTKYEKEKGDIKIDTQKKIEAFFKGIILAMLKGGGFNIVDSEKDFAYLQSLGYTNVDGIKGRYKKDGKGVIFHETDNKLSIYSGAGNFAFGRNPFMITGSVKYDKAQMKTLKGAIEVEEKAEKEPKTAEDFVKRAERLQDEEKYSEAIAAYDEAIKLDPLSTRYGCKGECLMKLKKYPEALFAYTEARKLESDESDQKKLDEIIKEIEVLISPAPVSEAAPEAAPAPEVKKPAKTSEKKKKVEKSYPINGIEIDNTLAGLTGKIKGIHVNLRKENGDKTGKTVSNDVSVNLTGKRSVNGKDIEYCEVVLPGENTKYFVAKKYIEVDAKQPKSDVPAKLTGLDKQESSELSKKDQLSKENQILLNANKSVEVGTYIITQGKVVGQDWGSNESGIKKTDEQLKKEGRETFGSTIELSKKDGKYILEMSRTGVFGLGNYTYSKGLTDKMPTKGELEKVVEEMRSAKQTDGLKNYAVTTGIYEVSTEIKKDI